MRYILALILALVGHTAAAQSNVLPYTKPNDRQVMAMRQDAVRLMSTPPTRLDGETNLACIAITVYHEARGESIPGQRAVADVVIQRALVPERWGSTPCEVVQPVQFSYLTSTRGFAKVNMRDPVERTAWERAVRVALTSLVMGPDPENKGADHYHTHDVTPDWRLAMPSSKVIGNHIFYVDPISVKKVHDYMIAAGQTPPNQITGTPVAYGQATGQISGQLVSVNPTQQEQVVDLYDWSGTGVPQKTQVIKHVDLYATAPASNKEESFEPVRAWNGVGRSADDTRQAQLQTASVGTKVAAATPQQAAQKATQTVMGLPANATFGFNAPASNGMRLGINPNRQPNNTQPAQNQ